MNKALFFFLFFLSSWSPTNSNMDDIHLNSPVRTLPSPATERSSLPYLFSTGQKLYLSWVEKQDDKLTLLKYSELRNGMWQPSKEIHRGTDWFVNWADFPAISENQGNLITHILKSSAPDVYAYDVRLNLKPQSSSTWKTDLPLHTDGTPTEHGFVSIQPFEDQFFINWLDGRQMMSQNHGAAHGAMSLRGAFVSPSGEVSGEKILDHRTCDCCQTSAAITANGPVVVFRDRSETEIRDISIVRWVNGQWTLPQSVYADNWQINGCPVNGPKAAALGNDLAVAWFTMAGGKPKVQMAFSEDNGVHFDSPLVLSESHVMGRVDIAYVGQKTVVVSWMEQIDDNAIIRVMRVSKDGQRSIPIDIEKTSAARVSGFPQMEVLNDKLYFAWTDYANDIEQVKTSFVPLTSFELP